MIKHLFKLIWNRKKSNFLMITEIFIAFFVLFMAFVMMCYIGGNYLKPLGFSYEDVWILSMDYKNTKTEEVIATLEQFENMLNAFSEVESVSFSNSLLFIPDGMSASDYSYDGKEVNAHNLYAGDNFHQVLNIELLSGRWFDKTDDAASIDPLVINYRLAEELFPNQDPLGKIITRGKKEYRVIGTVGEFRRAGELTGSIRGAFLRFKPDSENGRAVLKDGLFNRFLIKVKPGSGMAFERRMINQLSSAGKTFTLKARKMEDARKTAFKKTIVLPLILLVISSFMITNVALGLFGVIWYNINRRKPEIGLRRALGAPSNTIYKQIIGEALALTTFGITIGSFFALQFPLLKIFGFIENEVYFLAFVLSLLFIYMIVIICSLYPSHLAAKIQPAAALHED